MSDLLADPVMQTFAVCATVLILRMWLTGNATGLTRVVHGVYITEQGYQLTGKTDTGTDPLIERLRRIHQDDLENILPFLAAGFPVCLDRPLVRAGVVAVRPVHHRTHRPHDRLAGITAALAGAAVRTRQHHAARHHGAAIEQSLVGLSRQD